MRTIGVALVFLCVAVMAAGALHPRPPAGAPACPSGTTQQEGSQGTFCVDAQGLRQGPLTERRGDGSVSLRGTYQNGQYHGTFRAYDSQGQVLETYELVEGTGTFTIWYARSKPSFRRSYRAGQRHGPWIYWHRNGQKSQELTFVEGHQHGTTTSWAQDGAKSAQSEYVDGRPHGLQKRWQNGALKEEEEYVYGNRVRHTRHDTEDGTPHTQRWSLPTYEGEVATRTHSAIQRRWQACTANPQCEEQATNCCACEAEDYVAVHYRFEEEARAALGQDCEDTRCPQMDCQEVGARCDDGYCVSLTR